MTGALLTQIHAASTPVFVPAFQQWIDQALQPGGTTLDLLATATKLADTDLASALQLTSFEEDPVLAESFKKLSRILRHGEGQRINQVFWRNMRGVVGDLLKQLRDDEDVHRLIVRHPELLAPLGLEIPEPRVERLCCCAELRHKEPPTRGWRSLWRQLRRPEIHETDVPSLNVFLSAMGVRDDSWIDLGHGGGASLVNWGLAHPAIRFTGVDVLRRSPESANDAFPCSEELPPNVHYYLLSSLSEGSSRVAYALVPPQNGITEASIPKRFFRKMLGGGADVVSILYPFPYLGEVSNAPGPRGELGLQLARSGLLSRVGPRANPALALVASALDLLRPRGSGFLLTEQPTILAGALEFLSRDRRVDIVHYSPEPMNEGRLQGLGVEAYSPLSWELGFGRTGDRRLGRFTWAYPLVFRMK